MSEGEGSATSPCDMSVGAVVLIQILLSLKSMLNYSVKRNLFSLQLVLGVWQIRLPPNCLGSCTLMAVPHGNPGSWLLSGPDLDVVAIWGNELTDGSSLYTHPLCLLNIA